MKEVMENQVKEVELLISGLTVEVKTEKNIIRDKSSEILIKSIQIVKLIAEVKALKSLLKKEIKGKEVV